MPKNIIVANWKMNNDEYSSKKLTYEFLKLLAYKNNPKTTKILCVPFPFIKTINNMCDVRLSVFVGAQNCSGFSKGSHTGEVSALMLKSIGVSYAIVGHSERRENFNESNIEILDKINLLIENDITPIFCCGEPISIRSNNHHLDYVVNQLEETIFKLNKKNFNNLIIAYEPIWAIGTGKTAKLEDIKEVHDIIRKKIKSKYGTSVSNSISVLYGGSVTPNNAKKIFDLVNVDGGLIGGASLVAQDFIDIVNSVN